MLTLWLLTFLLEAMLYLVPAVWRFRKHVAAFLVLAIIGSVLGLANQIDIFPLLMTLFISIFRLGNLLRITKGRMNQHYLRTACMRTSLWIFILHIAVSFALIVVASFSNDIVWQTLAVIQLLIAAVLLCIVVKNVYKLKFHMPRLFLTDRELPTVSVAIPARNETTDLETCLRSILANDYPKLEILVLDDCSQATTADIIRSFAQDGVRFVKGHEPAERWLAKNQAYQKLFEEATGELILFCGVDVRFGPQAIRSMVNLMASRQKSMLSVLPIRTYSTAAATFIQPMRYWWELALPRRLFNKPAVLSTCWMIGRQDLKRFGGFSAVSHSILPERYFARELVKIDQYSFIRSSAELHVETTKNFHEQYATALRMHYPSMRRRPEAILLFTLFHTLFLLLPFGLLLFSLWLQPAGFWLPLATCLLLTITHIIIVSTTDPGNTLLASITFPTVALVEIYITYLSMLKYEFGVMEWKDRNICIPVMHVIPRLPELPKA